MKDPIITFSMPRSGSTFLMRLLNKSYDQTANPVRYNGECDVLHAWCETVRCITEQDNGGVKSQEQLKEDKEFLSHYHYASTKETINDLGQFWRNYCGANNNVWGWKNVNYGMYDSKRFHQQIDVLINVYPQCKFIFLDRKQKDVIKSMLATEWWEMGHKECSVRLSKQSENFQSVINKHRDRCHVLPYESLLKHSNFQQFLNQFNLNISYDNYMSLAKNPRKNDVNTKTEEIRDQLLQNQR